ncbi:MAG: hypothetical protein LBK04_05375 [Clostridiales Family XIII bacterium]|jgi:hypothetical protein|nr:hypothetical protein [Clostridiales Family XIII bacterium]
MNSGLLTYRLALTHVDMGWFLPDPDAESGDAIAKARHMRAAILSGNRDAAASFAKNLTHILKPPVETLLESSTKACLHMEPYLSPPAESSLVNAGFLSVIEGYDRLNKIAASCREAGEEVPYTTAESMNYRYDLKNNTFINWGSSMVIGLNKYMPNRKAFQVRGMVKGNLPVEIEYSGKLVGDDENRFFEPGLYLAGMIGRDLLKKTIEIVSKTNKTKGIRSLRLSFAQIDPIAYISINAMRRAEGKPHLDRSTCTIFTALPYDTFGGGPYPRHRAVSRAGRIEFDSWSMAVYPGTGTRFTVGADE